MYYNGKGFGLCSEISSLSSALPVSVSRAVCLCVMGTHTHTHTSEATQCTRSISSCHVRCVGVALHLTCPGPPTPFTFVSFETLPSPQSSRPQLLRAPFVALHPAGTLRKRSVITRSSLAPQLSEDLKLHLNQTMTANYAQPGKESITAAVDRLQQDVRTTSFFCDCDTRCALQLPCVLLNVLILVAAHK